MKTHNVLLSVAAVGALIPFLPIPNALRVMSCLVCGGYLYLYWDERWGRF